MLTHSRATSDTSGTLLSMVVDGVTVARYVDGTGIEPRLSPRPYLHPVSTLAGTVVTAAAPESHRWHLGLSVSLQDVAGANFWGDRTYVRGEGYIWRDNHGRIVHDSWLLRDDHRARQRLCWLDRTGRLLLTEVRDLSWRRAIAHPGSWELMFRFTLEADDAPVRLASPGANGRTGAGYGGFFWRFPASADVAVESPTGSGEDDIHNRAARWLTWSARTLDGRAYHLTFLPADTMTAADPWFVRVGSYPGVGSALAASDAVVLGAGEALTRSVRVFVGDGALPTGDGALPTGDGALPTGDGALPTGNGALPTGVGA